MAIVDFVFSNLLSNPSPEFQDRAADHWQQIAERIHVGSGYGMQFYEDGQVEMSFSAPLDLTREKFVEVAEEVGYDVASYEAWEETDDLGHPGGPGFLDLGVMLIPRART